MILWRCLWLRRLCWVGVVLCGGVVVVRRCGRCVGGVSVGRVGFGRAGGGARLGCRRCVGASLVGVAGFDSLACAVLSIGGDTPTAVGYWKG